MSKWASELWFFGKYMENGTLWLSLISEKPGGLDAAGDAGGGLAAAGCIGGR